MNLDARDLDIQQQTIKGNQRSNLVLTKNPASFFLCLDKLFQILQYAYPQAEPQAHLRGPLQGYATTNNTGRGRKGRY